MCKRLIGILLSLACLISTNPVAAQTPTPSSGPVYIVQSGDTLWSIALRFNVTISDIETVNSLPGTDIFVGEKLVIPGLQGISGILITRPVVFGETLRSISRQDGVDETFLRKLNHIVSPAELYAGYSLTLLQQEEHPTRTGHAALDKDETLLELAVKQNADPWTIAQANNLSGTWAGLPGDQLSLTSVTVAAGPSGFPAVFTSITVDPEAIVQGMTVQIMVKTTQAVSLAGSLMDHALHFFTQGDGSQVALQGVYALTSPGLYPLRIDATLPDGSLQSFEQMVKIQQGSFLSESLVVDPETVDPAVTGPEDQWLLSMTTPATSSKNWQGIFQLPVDSQDCIRSRFGTRRTYNGGALFTFHSGADFGVCSPIHPFDIYAPAGGVVVFTGLKTVRGNVTLIDHGWGVYSGIFHQSEIDVAVGDTVTAGQLIGKIGATGRVTGPHLHWDLWVNGVQVDPLLWLNEVFPH